MTRNGKVLPSSEIELNRGEDTTMTMTDATISGVENTEEDTSSFATGGSVDGQSWASFEFKPAKLSTFAHYYSLKFKNAYLESNFTQNRDASFVFFYAMMAIVMPVFGGLVVFEGLYSIYGETVNYSGEAVRNLSSLSPSLYLHTLLVEGVLTFDNITSASLSVWVEAVSTSTYVQSVAKAVLVGAFQGNSSGGTSIPVGSYERPHNDTTLAYVIAFPFVFVCSAVYFWVCYRYWKRYVVKRWEEHKVVFAWGGSIPFTVMLFATFYTFDTTVSGDSVSSILDVIEQQSTREGREAAMRAVLVDMTSMWNQDNFTGMIVLIMVCLFIVAADIVNVRWDVIAFNLISYSGVVLVMMWLVRADMKKNLLFHFDPKYVVLGIPISDGHYLISAIFLVVCSVGLSFSRRWREAVLRSQYHFAWAQKMADNRALFAARQDRVAKDLFFTSINHELVTPIHGVLGLVEMLESHIYELYTTQWKRREPKPTTADEQQSSTPGEAASVQGRTVGSANSQVVSMDLDTALKSMKAKRRDTMEDTKAAWNSTTTARTPPGISVMSIPSNSDTAMLAGVDEIAHDLIKNVKLTMGRQLNLVTDILDLSKITVGDVEIKEKHVNLQKLFKSILNPLEEQARLVDVHCERSLRLHHLSCAKGDIGILRPVCLVDAKRVKQITHNLTNNAIKYTPSGGIVTVSASLEVEKELAKTLTTVEVLLVIVVHDTGVGMAEPEAFKKPFRRYGSTQDAHGRLKGAGIGLALVHALCKAMNGELDVKSKVGEGTTCTVRLPVTISARYFKHFDMVTGKTGVETGKGGRTLDVQQFTF